jgi:hypothetical protein
MQTFLKKRLLQTSATFSHHHVVKNTSIKLVMSVPGPGWDDPILRLLALFVWLISHQPTVLFSQNKPATNNQPAILFSQNKSAPATGHL